MVSRCSLRGSPRDPWHISMSMAPWWASALLGFLVPACAVEVPIDPPSAVRTPAALDDEEEEATCDGYDPERFCDDCNPCTAKANCTPCETLPPSMRDTRRCTRNEELPPFCAGRTGCVHIPITTPPGQINSCFPVAGEDDLHPGSCRAGVCVENEPY